MDFSTVLLLVKMARKKVQQRIIPSNAVTRTQKRKRDAQTPDTLEESDTVQVVAGNEVKKADVSSKVEEEEYTVGEEEEVEYTVEEEADNRSLELYGRLVEEALTQGYIDGHDDGHDNPIPIELTLLSARFLCQCNIM